MRVAPLILSAAIAAGFFPEADVRAQDDTRSRISRPDEDWSITADQAKAIQTTHRMAECVVKSRAVQWSEVLAEMPGTAKEGERMRRLADDAGSCLARAASGAYDVTRLAFQPSVVRGPVAEALLERNFSTQARRRDKLAEPFEMATAVIRSDLGAKTRTSLVVLDFADCVYRSAAADTTALFATEPASPEEKAAIDRLSPRLGPCLSSGLEFKINRLLLRGALAEAAYRYAATAAISASTGAQN